MPQPHVPGMHSPRMVVAKVVVDLDVPHLDRPFDYLVPGAQQETLRVGSLVRVRWGNRRINGWVVGLADSTDHEGELSPVLRVLSPIPLFTTAMLTTYRYLAARFAVNLSQVLSLAIPARRQKVEEELRQEDSRPLRKQEMGELQIPSWWARSERTGLPRCAVQVVPHLEFEFLLETLTHCRSSGIPLVVTAPTFLAAKEIHRSLMERVPEARLGLTAAELPHAQRYETHLRALKGEYEAVIGTRTAIWTPFTEPALQLIWAEGSDHYRERRSPRVDVLDVAVARCRWENYGVACAALDRSVKAQALVNSGWADSFEPSQMSVRQQIPRIQLVDGESFEREGLSVLSVLPNPAFQVLRAGLEEGPVLVQVMAARKFVSLPCKNCGERPRCEGCSHFLALSEDPSHPGSHCVNCKQPFLTRRCQKCGFEAVRFREYGAERVGRELGRAFPQIPLVVSSSATKIRRRIRPVPQIVVATAGAEPQVRGHYAAVVIAEAERLAFADRSGAGEEAMRRWMSTFAMGKPGCRAVLSGDVPQVLGQALVRWRPVEFAQIELEERAQVGLYPARWTVGLQGSSRALAAVIGQLESPRHVLSPPEPSLDVLGFVGHLLDDDELDDIGQVSAVLACESSQSMSLMRHLKEIATARSLKRESKVKIVVDPPDLFAT